MYPALSVIFFSTLSGAGLGLLFWFGVGQVAGPLPLSREIALAPLALGTLLLGVGLASAFLHLGKPGRAWRAFSQWRTSWLSREAVAAALTFGAAALAGWAVWAAPTSAASTAAGALLALLSAITVYTTAGIYFSLRPIPAWHNGFVAPSFLLAAALSGAACWWLLLSLAAWRPGSAESLALGGGAIGYALLKIAYWRHVDRRGGDIDTSAATGLAGLGRVRPAESPHTESNYLLREMGYVLARRHARRLRIIVVLCGGALPVLCAAAALGGRGGALAALLATVGLAIGLLAERWLFFAEARHIVTAYYR